MIFPLQPSQCCTLEANSENSVLTILRLIDWLLYFQHFRGWDRSIAVSLRTVWAVVRDSASKKNKNRKSLSGVKGKRWKNAHQANRVHKEAGWLLIPDSINSGTRKISRDNWRCWEMNTGQFIMLVNSFFKKRTSKIKRGKICIQTQARNGT